MNTARPSDSAARILADGEVEEFRLLMEQHGKVRLSFDDARVLACQLLRVLALIREVAVSAVGAGDTAVDRPSCQLERTDQSIEFLSR
jgi:hypothetical protein